MEPNSFYVSLYHFIQNLKKALLTLDKHAPTGEDASYNNYPAKNYLFKVNNRRRSGVFIVNFETYFTLSSSVSIVNFEQVIVCWLVGCLLYPGWQIGIQKLS